TVRNIRDLNIPASARSLTFRTLLSIVPLLAVLFAIARGFGIENILESSIFNIFSANTAETEATVAYATTTDTLSLSAEQFAQADSGSATPESLVAYEQEGILFAEETTAEGRF